MKLHSISLLFLFLAISSPSFSFLFDVETISKAVKNWSNIKQGVVNITQKFVEYEKKELRDETPTDRQEYDYIVVGAGSAGSTVAARLSEIEQATVLLIEAGGHENLLVDVPLLAMFLQMDKNINWDYSTEPSDRYCTAMQNNQCRVPKGKIMGGSSTINFMIATRGISITM